jgi:antitoxin ParD1/3/4
MVQTPVLQITLTEEDLQFVRSKIATGEYASESEVLTDSLQMLRDEEADRERWEREVLLPIHDRLMANPSSAIPLEQVEKNLEARRRQRLKAS